MAVTEILYPYFMEIIEMRRKVIKACVNGNKLIVI